MKQEINLSLVIPVLNEGGNLKELIRRCLRVCRQNCRSFEIILVDDGSIDGSTAIITRAALYGWDIVFRGTLWPGPVIGDRCGDVIRRTVDEGHEIGLHAWRSMP